MVDVAIKTQSSTLDRMLADIRERAPSFAARTAEVEAARRIPADMIAQLRAIGVFRMSTPRSHGGLEFDYPSILEVLTELSDIEGSLGWVTMLGAGHIPYLAYLPRKSYDAIYANGPDVFLAGTAAPSGEGEMTDGGFRVTGRWPFASGCQNADWLFAGFIVTRDGEPVMGTSGKPLVRHIVLPANRFEIEDTWHVAGLKGTGSHHIKIKDELVPTEYTFKYEDESCLPGPLYRSGLHMIPLLHCCPAIGIAQGALRELVEVANTGRRRVMATESMRDSPLFQSDIGRIEADLKAARAVHKVQAQMLWQAAVAGELTLANLKLLLDVQQAASWVNTTCARIVDACYTLGGGSALYNSSPLQRRLRDIHASTQHAAVGPGVFVQSGAQRLGHKMKHPILE
jgi:alkylation response protein AidB-like acyl-CoA dehydrogenase